MLPSKYDVCWDESQRWSECVSTNFHSKNLEAECERPKLAFDNCITAWRHEVGYEMRIKGDHRGEPPPQCAAMSCLFQRCLQETQYDTEQCRKPMAQFKHCVKALYLDEFIRE